MFDFLIPQAHAQVGSTVQNAAAAGRDAAVAHGASGLQSLVGYVVNNIDNWIAGVFILGVFYILSKMAAKAIKETILREKGEDVQESALILVERITKITIVGIGATIALALNGLNFTAAIGALSLGIGFALKDIIGNFISGVIMLSQDRVRIGDFIKVGEILGTIVSIDTRATILQALDGTEVVIPNQNMLSQTLISYSTNPFRRIELVVGVDYKTDLPMVTSLIKGIIDKYEDIVKKPEPMVLIDAFGDSSININVKFWVESSANWLNIRSNLNNRIKKAFDELGVNIPFPIRTLKLDENDRAFLQTMDSLKKGVVPEKKAVQSADQVKTAAGNTESARTVPYSPFEGEKRAGATPAAPGTPAAPTPQTAPAAEPAVAPAPADIPQNSQPKPPPTHL